MKKTRMVRIVYDPDASEFEESFLVIRPTIYIGPMYSLGFIKLFRDTVKNRIQDVIHEVCDLYFFDSPPSGEDKKQVKVGS